MRVPDQIAAMLEPLAAQEKQVLLSRFGLDRGEPRTMAEAAEDLRLDVATVERTEARAVEKLRARS